MDSSRTSLLILSLFVVSLARAQDHPQEPCSLQDDNAHSPQLSAVEPVASTSWQCYANGKCSSFEVHAGDSIQVTRVLNGWTCGYVTSAGGAGPEWIRTDDVVPVTADPDPPLSAWVGTWTGGEDIVHIHRSSKNGWLALDGTATWNGINSNQHFGNLRGEGRPTGNKLHYTEGRGEYACAVAMRLIGDYILASDNQNCGGLNARFQGVWRRKKP